MNIAKKLTKIFSLIFFAAFLSSCDSGCVAENEFDGKFAEVKANPGSSRIVGTYDDTIDPVTGDVTGGQVVSWVDTGFRSNGEQFLIQITGKWSPWYGNEYRGGALESLKRCFYDDETKKFNICSKKSLLGNCICSANQISESEIVDDGVNIVEQPNCDAGHSSGDENNPEKCTCTTQSGVVTDYTAYHLPLDSINKITERAKPSALQEPCKYDAGLGLYIGLFGRSGNDTPSRIYHLFTEDSVCDIGFDSEGKCVDESGRDATKYIFKSKHDTIFVKDDKNGNNSDTDSYGAGAEMHSANEVVKLMIYDSFYLDNSGGYRVVFFNGVGKKDETGLLEFLVSLVEDTVLGEVDESTCTQSSPTSAKSCTREGGIIKFLYLSIVTDSGFIIMLQVLLSLYIAFYGLATLMGLADINKKELMSRVLKVSLIMFFTSASSWSFYNEIVIGFFKNGMDYVISVFMDLSDSNLNSGTSSLLIAQIDRANDVSSSTRFSYIDLTIQKMMSLAVAKKIFGLFFGEPFFGVLYIPIIYMLIAFFIYVMLLAASFYIINLLKLVLVLSLGPVFMCFSLFSQTNGIFKKWISFMGARSLEVIILFIMLYNFVILINTQFTELLSYRACVDTWGIAGMKLSILKSSTDRSLISWCADFVALGGLIFITKLVMDQIPNIAGYLITIGGDSNKDASSGVGRGQSSMGLAGKMMGDAFSVAKFGAGEAGNAVFVGSGVAVQGGTALARRAKAGVASSSLGQSIASSRIGQAAGRVNSMLPSGPRGAYRNKLIDDEIKKATAAGKKQGKSGEALDMHVRRATVEAMQLKMHRDPKAMKSDSAAGSQPTGMKLAGVDMTNIAKRLDKKLVDEPLKAFIQKEAKAIKGSAKGDLLLGKQMEAKLRERAEDWAEKNLAGGRAAAQQAMAKGGMQRLIKGESHVSTNKASKAAIQNPEFKNQYLQDLKDKEFKNSEKLAKAKEGIFGGRAHRMGNFISRNVFRTASNNPEKEREIFLAQMAKQERQAQYKKERVQQMTDNTILKSDKADKKSGKVDKETLAEIKERKKERKADKKEVHKANINMVRSLRNLRDRATGDMTLFEDKKDKRKRMADYDKDLKTYKGRQGIDTMKQLGNVKDELTGKSVFIERKMGGDREKKRDLKSEKDGLRNSLATYSKNLAKDSNVVKKEHDKKIGAILEKEHNLRQNKLDQEKAYDKQMKMLEEQREDTIRRMNEKINRSSGMSKEKKILNLKEENKKIESDIRRLRSDKEDVSKAYETALRSLNLDKEKLVDEKDKAMKEVDDKLKASKEGDDKKRDFLKEELKKATRKEVDARLKEVGVDKIAKEKLLAEAKLRLKDAERKREHQEKELNEKIKQQRKDIPLAKIEDKNAKEAQLKEMLEERRDIAAHSGLSKLDIENQQDKKDKTLIETTLFEEAERVRYLEEILKVESTEPEKNFNDYVTQEELDRRYDDEDAKEDLEQIKFDMEKAVRDEASQEDIDLLEQRENSVKELSESLEQMEKARNEEDVAKVAQAQENLDLARKRVLDVKNAEIANNMAKAAEAKLLEMEQELDGTNDLEAVRKKSEEIEGALQDSQRVKANTDALLGSDPNKSSAGKGQAAASKDKHLTKSNYATDKMQKQSRAKLAKLNKRMHESSLERLMNKDKDKLTTQEAREIENLKVEISKCEQDEKKYESEASQIDSKIRSLGSDDA